MGKRRRSWKLLVVLAIFAGVILAVGIWIRSRVVDDRTYILCLRIHAVAGGSMGYALKPGDPGYTYYTRIAPDENKARIKIAKAVAQAFGDCDSFR